MKSCMQKQKQLDQLKQIILVIHVYSITFESYLAYIIIKKYKKVKWEFRS